MRGALSMGCGPLADMEDPAEWVAHTVRFEKGDDIPEDMVPSTQFIYVRESDGKILGTIQIRHSFTPFLETYGGHIGYSIRPSERRKGYAKADASRLSSILQRTRTGKGNGLLRGYQCRKPEDDPCKRRRL